MEKIKALIIKYKVHIPYILLIITTFVVFLYLISMASRKHTAELQGLKKELVEERKIKETLEDEVDKKKEEIIGLDKELIKVQKEIDKLKRNLNEIPKPDYTNMPSNDNELKRDILKSARKINSSK